MLPAAVHGPSWTTDAPFRETVEEIAKYRTAATELEVIQGLWTLFEAAEACLSA